MASNVQAHREAHNAFNRRDWDATIRLCADTISYTDQARGVTVKSPEEFKDWLSAWAQAFSDGQIANADYIDAGDWTVAHYMGRGTNDGPLGPLPATGRRASVPMCEILHWNEEGKIAEGATFYDQLSILVQLGHAEPPPTA